MLKRFVISSALFFSCLFVFSQDYLPHAYEINNDTADFQQISDTCWQFLGIKNENWSIDQVSQSPLSNRFHFKNQVPQGEDTSFYKYWLRFRLKNKMNRQANIALPTGADYADFYVSGKAVNNWKHYSTGNLQPWDKKEGLKFATAIPVTLEQGEEITIYYFAVNSDPRPVRTFRYSIRSIAGIFNYYANFVDNENEYHNSFELIEAFMIGFLFVAFFYTLVFFRIVKEAVYLYFSLFVFFLCVLRLNNISFSYLSREAPPLAKYAGYLNYSWAFITFFLIQFIRYFFRTFIKYRYWDKLLLVVGLLNIFIYVLVFLSQSYFPKELAFVYPVYVLASKLIPLMLLLTLFVYTKKAGRLNWLVIVGAFPMLFLYGVLTWFVDESGDHAKLNPLAKWFANYFRATEALSILLFVLSFSMILFIRFNRLRKENAQRLLDNERLAKEKEVERSELIAKQKIDLEKQVAARTAELKQSLEDLKSTQSQLVQSEKMASLGELTAGIAHEIQNPLNFVNNFSDVNKELLKEMKEEMEKGNVDEAKIIANDIIGNEEKINNHGKRADNIVKGMLQHTRISGGTKEPVDINALADEYLRLSYHGMRAKDKSFTATLKTDFDLSTGKTDIIPQDIGRVLLNLYNNAFYAVNEKKKLLVGSYEPLVSVSTKKIADKIFISVKDNGNGIPQKIVDKIFQPFFTTKPTGQGTGLGLSLSYDIIKAHGGEIKVKSKEGEGTDFIIVLPA